MIVIVCAACGSYPAKFTAQQWFLGWCCVTQLNYTCAKCGIACPQHAPDATERAVCAACRAKPDFTCRVCGAVTVCAPDPPERAICPECCEKSEDGHEYKYERGERDYYCLHCGDRPPYQWYADRA